MTWIYTVLGYLCAVSTSDQPLSDLYILWPSTADPRTAGIWCSEPRRLARQPWVGGATDHVRLWCPCSSSRSVLWPRRSVQQCRGSSSAACCRRPTTGFPLPSRRLLRCRWPGNDLSSDGNKTKVLRPNQDQYKQQQDYITEKNSSVATRMFVIK